MDLLWSTKAILPDESGESGGAAMDAAIRTSRDCAQSAMIARLYESVTSFFNGTK